MTLVKPEISAIVVCFNEKENIGPCLDSLTWCDEIVVVDSFSTDGTVEICRRYTERVFQRAWMGYRNQKSFAHSKATKEWVILVDSDERVPPELRAEIQVALAKDRNRYVGYSIPRLVYYLGRWWWRGGWYPDYDIRVFRNKLARWGGLDPHERIYVDGKVRRLVHPLHHYSYRNIGDHLDRVNHFTDLSARELRECGRRWHWYDGVIHAPFRFFKSFVWKRGFQEGAAGFFVAATAAFYVFMKYAKLRELEINRAVKNSREQ
jgi:glycosyltransferase involved in cell wall biosynthesis